MGNSCCQGKLKEEELFITKRIYSKELNSQSKVVIIQKQGSIENGDVCSYKAAVISLQSSPNPKLNISLPDTDLFQDQKTSRHAPLVQYARPIKIIPNFSTQIIRETIEKLPTFEFDDLDQDLRGENLGPFEFLTDNTVYIGEWRDGRRYGRGKQYWQDGSFFEGYWEDDYAKGRGRLIHPTGDFYEGNWFKDKAQGKGRYISRDGSQYDGDWVEDKMEGFGKESWLDGSWYEGQYKANCKHGRGLFVWPNGNSYQGDLNMNEIDGFGLYKWGGQKGKCYSGIWKNNLMHGKGIFTWGDGKKYVGQYKQDRKHGFGEFYWPDGRGDWKNGRQHGQGVYCGHDGIEQSGIWSCGKKLQNAQEDKSGWLVVIENESKIDAESPT